MKSYITAEQAAELLNVSVPWFITNVTPEITDRLYYYGETTYGETNVLKWKRKRDTMRSLALDELTALGESMDCDS